MKKFFYSLAVLTLASTLSLGAQTPGGGISEDMLSIIRTGYSGTTAQKAAKNALARNSIASLTYNADNALIIRTC